jgi:uncharacterized membrane protein YcjF (UPF0283 family)
MEFLFFFRGWLVCLEARMRLMVRKEISCRDEDIEYWCLFFSLYVGVWKERWRVGVWPEDRMLEETRCLVGRVYFLQEFSFLVCVIVIRNWSFCL